MGQRSDLYYKRKELHRCVRCGAPAAPDSDFCVPHERDARDRAAKAMKKRRADFKRRRRCTCGRKRQAQSRLCSRCLMRLGRLRSSFVNNGVNNRTRVADRTVVDKDGRTRYLGQVRRGAPSVGRTDSWDLALARKELTKAEEGHAYYESNAAQELPRIQREDIRQAYLGRMFASARALLLACKRGGWTIPGLNDEDESEKQIAASPRKSGR